MLIQPLSRATLQRTQAIGRPSAQAFRVAVPDEASRPAGPTSIAALSSLQTLLAVQEVGPTGIERRRRAVRRGQQLLSSLSRLQLAMLGDGDSSACLEDVRSIVREEAGEVDDDELAAILEEIEVRAAVEIAKRDAGREQEAAAPAPVGFIRSRT